MYCAEVQERTSYVYVRAYVRIASRGLLLMLRVFVCCQDQVVPRVSRPQHHVPSPTGTGLHAQAWLLSP